MIPYNMALANFLFALLKVGLIAFLTNSMDIEHLYG